MCLQRNGIIVNSHLTERRSLLRALHVNSIVDEPGLLPRLRSALQDYETGLCQPTGSVQPPPPQRYGDGSPVDVDLDDEMKVRVMRWM